MHAAPTLLEALQTLLSHGPAAARASALEVLAALPSPHAAAGLALLEEWEPGTPLAAAARERCEVMRAHLTGAALTLDEGVAQAFCDAAAAYRILGALGEGPGGRAFLVVQVGMRRLVALKVLAPADGENTARVGCAAESMSCQRFQRAAQAMGRLLHPHLCTIFDAGVIRGIAFRAQELVDGRNLHQLVASEGALEPRRAAGLVAGVALGLAAAHRAGLTHRAIKPGNILVGRHDNGKLTDFAPGGPPAGPPSAHDVLTGAASYRAPEEARGVAPDGRADLYALGAALYHLLAGHPPFSGDSAAAVAAQQLAGPAPELPVGLEVPTTLRVLVERLLAPEPDGRPGSASDVAEACRAVLGGRPMVVMSAPGAPAAALGPDGTAPAGSDAAAPLVPKTVLVVDDSQLVLRVLHRVLSANGYHVLTAESPQEALALVQTQRVDVLITDMVFPDGETGRDLVAVMRKERPGMPVLAMSGQVGLSARQELLGQGVANFLDKPLEPAEVLSAVGRACVGVNRSLLLVDDDRLIRLVLRRLFESNGFRVRTAATIEEARGVLAEAPPDVIVSDLKVRSQSGLDLLKDVRDAGLQTPFIMLSGSPDAESVIAAYRLRVVDFVVKSDDMKQLIDAIEGAVGPGA